MYKKVLYAAGGVVLIGVLWFAYYAISPLFIVVRVDEEAPVASGVAPEVMVPEAAASQSQPPAAEVVGTVGHPASGTARIVKADGAAYLRYENLKTINGPDLYVYLAKDKDAHEFVSLGKLRATEGNVNYEIPTGIDISEYRYALIWCKQFGVLFNSADLSS